MVDPSTGIPADGISFDKAFELVFDAMRPDAGELRAAIEGAVEGQPEDDEIWAQWQAAILEVDAFFRTELGYDLSPNALTAYQRHPWGIEQVAQRYWQEAPIQPGAVNETPPIFFLRAEFEAWLRNKTSLPKKQGGRPPAVSWNDVVKAALFKLLDHHGLPSIDDPEWQNQAAVERAVSEIILDKYGFEVAESTVRVHTARLLTEWRNQAGRN
jgi:hypothetical protein